MDIELNNGHPVMNVASLKTLLSLLGKELSEDDPNIDEEYDVYVGLGLVYLLNVAFNTENIELTDVFDNLPIINNSVDDTREFNIDIYNDLGLPIKSIKGGELEGLIADNIDLMMFGIDKETLLTILTALGNEIVTGLPEQPNLDSEIKELYYSVGLNYITHLCVKYNEPLLLNVLANLPIISNSVELTAEYIYEQLSEK